MLFDAKPLEGYREPYGLLCAILQDGTNEWRAELDPNLPDDALVWQPISDGHSIGAIILHMISAERFWFEKFALDLEPDPEESKLLLADEGDIETGKWPVPPRMPLKDYLALQDSIRLRTLERIKGWPEADSIKPLQTVECSMRWVLGHVIQHEAYHGGQARCS